MPNLSTITDNLPSIIFVNHLDRVDVKNFQKLSAKFGAFLRRPRRKLLLLLGRRRSLSPEVA